MHDYVRGRWGKLKISKIEEVMIMAGGKELVKYMAEKFVAYVETPSEERKQAKTSAKANREHWLTRWFGWGPMSLVLWWRRREQRQR